MNTLSHNSKKTSEQSKIKNIYCQAIKRFKKRKKNNCKKYKEEPMFTRRMWTMEEDNAI